MATTPDIMFHHLGLSIYNLPRTVFSVFGFGIYYYGLLIAIGIMLATLLTSYQARKTGQDPDAYVNFLVYALFAAIIGGRLHFVMFSWDYYSHNPGQILNLRGGGIGFYGAILSALAVFIIYSRRKKLDTLLFLDTAMPTVLIGQALGRWGNFFNREAYGVFTNSFMAMSIRLEDVRGPVTEEMMNNLLILGDTQYIQVHPTFLYESIWNILAFCLISLYRPHQRFRGEVGLLYFTLYGFGRFFIEGLRADQLLLWGTGLAISQLISATLFLGSLTIIILFRHKAKLAA